MVRVVAYVLIIFFVYLSAGIFLLFRNSSSGNRNAPAQDVSKVLRVAVHQNSTLLQTVQISDKIVLKSQNSDVDKTISLKASIPTAQSLRQKITTTHLSRNTDPPVNGKESDEESVSSIISKLHPVRDEFKVAVEEYIAMHRRVVQNVGGELKPREKGVRVLQFSPTGQLCNRIRGTIAAFTFAFLTNRVFVLKGFGYRETSSYYQLFRSPGFFIEGPFSGTWEQTSRFIDMQVDGGNKIQKVELFTCTDWSAVDEDISMTGTDYTTTFLYRNPYLQKRISELFLDEDIFRPILFWLFRPIAEIEMRRDEFLRSNNMLGSVESRPYTVAFHIRNEFPISPTEWTTYKDCAVATIPHNRKINHSPIWFVATDSKEARGIAKYNLNNNSIFYTPAAGFLKGAMLEGLKQALTEILIASSCDSIFLTPFSSFSRIISLYARTPYTFVVTDYVMPEQDTHRTMTKIQDNCFRYIRKEECAWPGHMTSINSLLEKISCFSPYMISDIC